MAIKFGANELIRDEHFLVKSKEVKQTVKGDNYYVLELSNKDGTIEAKIWNNNISMCNFEEGKVIEVNGKSQEYNGKISLIIDSCQTIDSEETSQYSPSVPTLVFDLETVGKDFDQLDESEKDYLLNNLEKNEEDKELAKTKTALYSIFGKICAIGAMDVYRNKGFVLSLSNKEIMPEKDNFEYEIFENEKELIKRFWEKCANFEQFVTYNGEGFDFPYLMIRSGINRVKMPFEIRKWSDKFIDLQNKIRQNRAYTLEMLCKAFGIKNPKEEGVHGNNVSCLFKDEEFNKIADYVARDATATAELFLIWKNYMSGI